MKVPYAGRAIVCQAAYRLARTGYKNDAKLVTQEKRLIKLIFAGSADSFLNAKT